jgi:hypothetical protein
MTDKIAEHYTLTFSLDNDSYLGFMKKYGPPSFLQDGQVGIPMEPVCSEAQIKQTTNPQS